MHLFSDRGIPYSYRWEESNYLDHPISSVTCMDSVVTHSRWSMQKEFPSTSNFISRWLLIVVLNFFSSHLQTKQGIKSLKPCEATRIGGEDPDFYIRYVNYIISIVKLHFSDLFDAIEGGNYPEWEMNIQVFSVFLRIWKYIVNCRWCRSIKLRNVSSIPSMSLKSGQKENIPLFLLENSSSIRILSIISLRYSIPSSSHLLLFSSGGTSCILSCSYHSWNWILSWSNAPSTYHSIHSGQS